MPPSIDGVRRMALMPLPLLICLLFACALYMAMIMYLRREGYPRSAIAVGSVFLLALGCVLYAFSR